MSHVLIVGLDTFVPSTSSSLYCGPRATSQNHPGPKALLSSQGVFWGLLGPVCLGLVCFKLQSCQNPEPNSPLTRSSPRTQREPRGWARTLPAPPQAPLQGSGSPLLSSGYMLGAKPVPLEMVVALGPQQCHMPISWQVAQSCQAALDVLLSPMSRLGRPRSMQPPLIWNSRPLDLSYNGLFQPTLALGLCCRTELANTHR